VQQPVCRPPIERAVLDVRAEHPGALLVAAAEEIAAIVIVRWRPALGLIISERAGVLNLTAEGLMLVGALAGIVAFTLLGGHPLAALAASMLAATLVSILLALPVVYLKTNQVLAGLAMVFFCGLGGTLLCSTLFLQIGQGFTPIHAALCTVPQPEGEHTCQLLQTALVVARQ